MFTDEHHYLEARVREYSLLSMTLGMEQIFLEWPGEMLPNFNLASQLKLIVFLISPAQGAMFAPLALKSVSRVSGFPWLISSFYTEFLYKQYTSILPRHENHRYQKLSWVLSQPYCLSLELLPSFYGIDGDRIRRILGRRQLLICGRCQEYSSRHSP